MSQLNSRLRLLALALFAVPAFGACASDRPSERQVVGPALVGKTRQDIVTCAGAPLREIQTADDTVLKYYKEIPMLEESQVSSKGSRPRAHGGCWASISISQDRVIGVEFDSVPASGLADMYCEDIFETCITPPSSP